MNTKTHKNETAAHGQNVRECPKCGLDQQSAEAAAIWKHKANPNKDNCLACNSNLVRPISYDVALNTSPPDAPKTPAPAPEREAQARWLHKWQKKAPERLGEIRQAEKARRGIGGCPSGFSDQIYCEAAAPEAPRDRSLEQIGGSPDEIALALHNDAVGRKSDAAYKAHVESERAIKQIIDKPQSGKVAHTPGPRRMNASDEAYLQSWKDRACRAEEQLDETAAERDTWKRQYGAALQVIDRTVAERDSLKEQLENVHNASERAENEADLLRQIVEPAQKLLDYIDRNWPGKRSERLPVQELRAAIERHTNKGVWNEKSKSYITPSGTVKQGRRPMFKPFARAEGRAQTSAG